MSDKSFTVSGWLVIEGRKRSSYSDYYSGSIVKITKSKPAISNRQICIAVNINVPIAFFERLTPVINIDLPKEAILNPDSEIVIDLSAIEVADKLNLEVTDVKDALTELIEAKKAEIEDKISAKKIAPDTFISGGTGGGSNDSGKAGGSGV